MIVFYVSTDGYSAAPEGYPMPGDHFHAWARVLYYFDPFQKVR
jgi:hypothetical protein